MREFLTMHARYVEKRNGGVRQLEEQMIGKLKTATLRPT